MALQESGEMYLETIYVLTKSSSFVRAVDISEHMGFSKPSVSRAMGLLKADGYITVDPQAGIRLTPRGLEVVYVSYAMLPDAPAGQDAMRQSDRLGMVWGSDALVHIDGAG